MREEWIKSKKKNYENPIADIMAGVIKPLLNKQNSLEAEIRMNWNKIFPHDINSKCEFLKLTFKNKTSQCCALHVSVQPAFAIEISYKTAQMIEMLSVFLGRKAVEEIRVVKR